MLKISGESSGGGSGEPLRLGRCSLIRRITDVGNCLWADAEAFPGRVLTELPIGWERALPVEESADILLCRDLQRLSRKYRGRTLSCHGWFPDPAKWPQTSAYAARVGLKIAVLPHLSSWWDETVRTGK